MWISPPHSIVGMVENELRDIETVQDIPCESTPSRVIGLKTRDRLLFSKYIIVSVTYGVLDLTYLSSYVR